MKPIFIIEHLEPRLWPWCTIEYKSISKIIGKSNVWFTNIRQKDAKKLKKYGKVFTKSVRDLDIKSKKSCILDPLAEKTLHPKESKKFKYYIFGGILGDAELNGRTKKELTKFLSKANKRNIGKEQFSTDNAVYVTSKISHGRSLNEIKIKKGLEIKINSVESIILPYSYPIVSKKPRISKELVSYLKRKKGF